ncbi:hypothetical protein D7X33_10690 [Butyricicoccus sp. 1XD8-22]|nr:hypothetical protein D7X33_10690 [Butyricicoccus sp. 1XD8-22]
MNKTLKHCRTCNAIIARNAKRCLHCGSRNYNLPLIRGLVAFFAALFTLLSIIFISESSGDKAEAQRSALAVNAAVSVVAEDMADVVD